MAIEYLSYAGAMPFQSGVSSMSNSHDSFSEAGGTTWDDIGGVYSSYSSSNSTHDYLTEDQGGEQITGTGSYHFEASPGAFMDGTYYLWGWVPSIVTTAESTSSESFSISDLTIGEHPILSMQTSTTVEQTADGKTTTHTALTHVPTVVTTTASSTSGTFYTTRTVASTITETTRGSESLTYAGLALTDAGLGEVAAAQIWNTIVIADTAAGEFLIVPTAEGEGMLSDLCTTAPATTFYGSAFTPGGGGGQDYIYTTLGSDYTTTSEVASTLGTGTATIQIAAFPALTSARTYEIASLTSTTTAPYSDNGFDQWTIALPALTDATQHISPAPSVAPYTENYTGPAAMGYFPAAATTGMVPVGVAIGSPLPAIPRMQVITGSAQTLFSGSAFACPMAVPPSTTSFTASSGFAEAIHAGVMVGSYPAEQWVEVYPGVVMPMPVDTFLPLNYTQDSHTQGSCAVTTSASVSYGSGGYSVTTATSSGSGSEATTVNGTTFYSFAGVGMTSAVSQLDSIAGGNPYFPSAIYAGTSMTVELQTWDASSSGTLLTTFSGSDEVSGDGLSLVVPDVSAVAYHWMDFPTIGFGGQYTSYFDAAPYLVSNPG